VTGRLRSGVLAVEKGPGVTSFQVVAQLRRLLRAPRVGHGGTLDPDATGVLPVLVGEATKLTPYLIELDKEYVATVQLGVVTSTQDASGTVLATRPVPPLGDTDIAAVLARFTGQIHQVPPMYSALHRGGRRLYEIAREGGEVERAPRLVRVHRLELLAREDTRLTLGVTCGKGTYVRTLAADIGEALGPGASLAGLVRTRVGPFRLEACLPWPELVALRSGEALWARLLPPDAALVDLPPVRLGGEAARAFRHGRAVAGAGGPAALVRVYGPAGELIGLGRPRGDRLQPERLLHADDPGTPVLPA
jgi:tRNA pseudouridine55 synthase